MIRERGVPHQHPSRLNAGIRYEMISSALFGMTDSIAARNFARMPPSGLRHSREVLINGE